MTSTVRPATLMRAFALASVATLASGALSCARAPSLSFHAPGRIEQALSVASDLKASAVLVEKGGKAGDAQALDRGDDNVTFSGFIECAPGKYTLEITFTGVVDGDRRFLGRITSDSFTVSQGSSATPVFSNAVDTIGRDGEHGDDDADGLGFLDELLLGADPTSDDSDGDGVKDGADCVPTDGNDAFTIADGGTFEDCDADGFRAVTAPLGGAGQDCDDEAGNVNPSIDDDCTNSVDEDCNPQTCPIADFEGPTVEIISPADGATIGCNTPFQIHATDPSDVASAFMKAPDAPVAGNNDRFVPLHQQDDDVTWLAEDGFGGSGGGISDGAFAVDVTAADNAANSTTVHASYTMQLGFPSVDMTGPDSIVDGAPVDITLTPTGPAPLVSLELHAAPFDTASTLLDISGEIVLGSVAVGGGTISVDPGDIDGNFVVYPVAVDGVGNRAAPGAFSSFVPSLRTVTASYLCDGASHSLPAIGRLRNVGPMKMSDGLQQAIDMAHGVDPDAFLVIVIGFGARSDGTIDLASTGFLQWIYGFAVPSRIQQLGDNADGISVTYFSAGFGQGSDPVLDDTAGNIFEQDAIVNVNGMIDSDVVAAAYPCGGLGLQGTDSDYIQYIRSTGFNADQVAVTPVNGADWGVHADNLSIETFGCSP